MSRKAKSLAAIDTRLRELAAAKSALEQELDQGLGRALRRTREHAPADVWESIQRLLAPHVRTDADRRALGLTNPADGHSAGTAEVPSPMQRPLPATSRDVVPTAVSRRQHTSAHREVHSTAAVSEGVAVVNSRSGAEQDASSTPARSAAQLTLG